MPEEDFEKIDNEEILSDDNSSPFNSKTNNSEDNIIDFPSDNSNIIEEDNVIDFPYDNVNNENDNTALNTSESKSDENSIKEKVEDNKSKNYQQASSGREAFERKLKDKNYYNKRSEDAKNRESSSKDKITEIAKKRDTAEERLQKARDNRNQNKNSETKKELKDAKKSLKNIKGEEKDAKDEEKKAKDEQKLLKKDSLKSKAFAATHPGEAATMMLKEVAKKAAKKVALIVLTWVAPILLGLFGIIIVIQILMGPLMEAWENFDKGVTDIANGVEKLTNFYKGFGFQDSKTAFFSQVEELDEYYDGQLKDQIPLIMATLFYTETTGFDTQYGVVDSSEAESDLFSPFSANGIKGLIEFFKEWSSEKIEEAQNTVDENGLTYNAGKIYRLRKLVRANFTRDNGDEITEPLSDFIPKLSKLIGKAELEFLQSIGSATLSTIMNSGSILWNLITFDFDSVEKAAWNLKDNYSDVVDCFKQLFQIISFGLCTITKVELDLLGEDGFFSFNVTYKRFGFDISEYDNYLRNHYIPYMPEFQDMLPSNAEDKAEKIEQIISGIHQNEKLFRDLYFNELPESTEEYVDTCVGAVNSDIMSKLKLPVEMKNSSPTFEPADMFGLYGGTIHNGVVLNNSNSGINEGDNVYAIAGGEVVESVSNVSCNKSTDSNCDSNGSWIKLKHSITIDGTQYNFYTVYKYLQANSGQPPTGNSVSQGDIIGKVGNTGNATQASLYFEFDDESETPIDPTNLFIPCSATMNGDFDIHTTTLTRDKFISDVTSNLRNYSYNSSRENAITLFEQNAGNIYDFSVKNNLNPEFVITRAIKEGYSPSNKDISGYNFWGIGCTNTGGVNACKNFASLEEGIKYLANMEIVKNAKTVSETMSKYAYIGKYWYNPGNSGQGGCYYFDYIKKYMIQNRINVVSNACASSNICDGNRCIETTDDDQKAYTLYQMEGMTSSRSTIFGL